MAERRRPLDLRRRALLKMRRRLALQSREVGLTRRKMIVLTVDKVDSDSDGPRCPPILEEVQKRLNIIDR